MNAWCSLCASGNGNRDNKLFGLYIPTIGIFISIFSVLLLFIWDIMVARRLFELARSQNGVF